MGRLHSAHNPLGGRPVGSKWDHVVDPQAEQHALEVSKNDCQTPRRPLDKTHLLMEPGDSNRAQRVSEGRKTSQEMGRRHQFILTTNHNGLTNDTTSLTAAQDGLKWDFMESDFVNSGLKQATRLTTLTVATATITPTKARQTTHTTKAHNRKLMLQRHR